MRNNGYFIILKVNYKFVFKVIVCVINVNILFIDNIGYIIVYVRYNVKWVWYKNVCKVYGVKIVVWYI